MKKQSYHIEFSVVDSEGFYHDILDSEEVSWRLGRHLVFDIVQQTPQGPKRLIVTTEVSRYP